MVSNALPLWRSPISHHNMFNTPERHVRIQRRNNEKNQKKKQEKRNEGVSRHAPFPGTQSEQGGSRDTHVSLSLRARRDVLKCNPTVVGRALLELLSSRCHGLPGRAWSSLSIGRSSTSRGGSFKLLLVRCVLQNACKGSGRVVAVFAGTSLFLQVSCCGVRSKTAGCVLGSILGKNTNHDEHFLDEGPGRPEGVQSQTMFRRRWAKTAPAIVR